MVPRHLRDGVLIRHTTTICGGPHCTYVETEAKIHLVLVVLGLCLAPIRSYGDLNLGLVQPSPGFRH